MTNRQRAKLSEKVHRPLVGLDISEALIVLEVVLAVTLEPYEQADALLDELHRCVRGAIEKRQQDAARKVM